MIEKTQFTKQEIIKVIKEYYGIDIKKIKHIDKGSGNLFILFSNTKKYVLKEFQSSYKAESIQKEYDLIKSLDLDNTYKYFLTNQNKCYFVYKERVCILIEYIDGTEYQNNTLDIDTLKSVAILHAKITQKLNLKNDFESFENFCTKEKINKNKDYMINKISEYYTSENHKKILNDYKVKINIIDSLDLDKIFENLNQKIKCINCHGDFSVQQLIFNENKINVLDFASNRKLPISWEIIRSYSYGDKKCVNGNIDIDNLIEYTKSFDSIFNLSYEEIIYMPIIYLLQLLQSNYGYKQFFNDKNQDLLNFANYRTRLCEDIFNNLDLFTQKLIQYAQKKL